jgi:alpha-beta hydrolase superfamily lysophospholipase
MGSYLLRKYLTIYGDGLSGAILAGTGQVMDAALKLALTVCESLARKHGWHYRSTLVQQMTYTGPYRKFDLTGEHPENNWLSKDLEVLKTYYGNEKCSFVFTLNGYKALFNTIYYDNQTENIEKLPKDLPLLLVSGEDDPVGDLGKGVKQVYNRMVQAGVTDIFCRLFENDRHEILNETDRADVYQYLLTWLEEHL